VKQSDRKAILALLKDGNIETRKTIDRKIGTLKGPSRISDLRSQGHNIIDRRIISKNGRRVNAYLIPDAIPQGTGVVYCNDCEVIGKRSSTDGTICRDCDEKMEIVVPVNGEVEVA